MVFLMSTVHASTGHLSISNVDVKVASKTIRGLQSGSSIPEDARPGQTVEFRVTVTNNFSTTENLRIQDITVKTTIEGIDNGNDLEIESDRFDLRANTDRKTIFTFNVPLEVLEDTFNVIIHAEGQDENGTIDIAETKLKLEIQKDNHKLIFVRKALTPSVITCSRNNVQLAATVLDIGNFNEDSVTVTIKNKDLGIDIKDQIGALKARPNEPDSRFAKTYPLKIPANAEAGSYPIDLKLSYNDDRQVTSDSITLTVNECNKVQPVAPNPVNNNGGVDVVLPPTEKPAPVVQQPPLPEGTVSTQESFLTGNTFIVGILIAEIVAVIIGGVGVFTLFRRRS